MPRTSPSEGQIRCQGLEGHQWRPIPPPPGYRSMWYVTVHLLCESCGTVKRVHLDAQGRTHQGGYIRRHDWVKYSLDDGPTSAQKRLAYIRTLDNSLLEGTRKNGRRR